MLTVLCYFGSGTSGTRPWNAAPLFSYAAPLAFLLPALIELARRSGRLPPLPSGTSWLQVHLGLTMIALLSTLLVFLTGEDSTVALPIAIAGGAGILLGARALDHEHRAIAR